MRVLRLLLSGADGAGILSLAGDYPRPGIAFDRALAELAAAKGLRLYLEYPSALPGIAVAPPRQARWERAVVSSDRLPRLEPGAILAQHGCWYTPVEAVDERDLEAYLCAARVAGYDRAIYGLPEDEPLFHQRVLKEAAHELGHTYGLGHCPDNKCVMHFSNSLRDTDIKGTEFCPRCQVQLKE